MPTLTREILAQEVNDLLDLKLVRNHPVHSYKIIRAIFNTITNAIKRGEKVYVKGFGTFQINTWKPRGSGNNFIDPYRNRSPVPLHHPSKRKVTFKPARAVKAMLNGPTTWHERDCIRSWNLLEKAKP